MTHQINSMETLVSDLKQQQEQLSDVPSMIDDNSDKSATSTLGFHSPPPLSPPQPYHNNNNNNKCCYDYNNKRIKLFETPPLQAFIATTPDDNDHQVKPWKLTLEQGQMVIETHVKNHTDLLHNLHHMIRTTSFSLQIQPNLPLMQPNSLIGVLNNVIRKRYGRTHCKNVGRSVRIFVVPSFAATHDLTLARPPDSIDTTTLKLLAAYLTCQHLQQLAIHVPTVRRYLDETSALGGTAANLSMTSSPAIMALCAAICTMRCKHINQAVSVVSLAEYGAFYFDRARMLVDFDQLDEETMTTYTFMTVYALAVSRRTEAKLYADLAERIATLLVPTVHTRRLRAHLHRVLTFQSISSASNAQDDLPYCTLIHQDEGGYETSPDDDSLLEHRFATMHNAIVQLQRAGHEASRAAQSSDLQHLVGLIGHQVEMAICHWYQQLPSDFRLQTVPLFDGELCCKELEERVGRECDGRDPVPVLTTLALYEEWLIVGQSYLPKKLSDPPPTTAAGCDNKQSCCDAKQSCCDNKQSSAAECGNNKQPLPACNVKSFTGFGKKRVAKLMQLRDQIDFEGSDEDYLVAITQLMAPIETRIQTEMVIKSLHAAFHTVHLASYLRRRPNDCYFEMRVLVNAWQLLVRVSRLENVLPSEVTALMPRVRHAMADCLTIVQEELEMQPCQIGDYVAEMESDFADVQSLDDCDCVACPNA
ncbi:MAG: hypothetical protein EXX96DRAFT_581135 [Benjaminiella poitrasii]|nr:MAG: hypothetical protein EXX96DRAFT_581135 [Benjaminiella poitrasii]